MLVLEQPVFHQLISGAPFHSEGQHWYRLVCMCVLPNNFDVQYHLHCLR